jgi:hypothetical protein
MADIKPEKFTIRIESILGGQSPTTHFAASDQFRMSMGIDPSLPADNADTDFTSIATGFLRPSGSNANFTTTGTVMWIVDNPKVTNSSDLNFSYAYDHNGSTYSINGSATQITALSDGGSMSNASANGAEYYDNYVYFAKNTTIARYGPLNGTPSFDGDYWVTTLSKAALNNTGYPGDPWIGNLYRNHVMHRHSDGKLYIADVQGNKGVIHVISTSKTTEEGDTDNGSTFQKLTFGYGLYPIAIESYGPNLAIALIEYNSNTNYSGPIQRGKLAFWDTTSQNANQITWVEYPDGLLTALKNVDGVLYAFSGSADDFGFRVVRFVGGYTFEEVAFCEMGFSPHQGAVTGKGDNLLIGSANVIGISNSWACVWSLGLHKNNLSKGLFNIARIGYKAGSYYGQGVTAIGYEEGNFNQTGLHVAWAQNSNAGGGIDRVFQSTLEAEPIWWSQTYKIGQPFKITKVRIPTLKSGSGSQKQIIPKIYTDNGQNSFTLQTLDYSATKRSYALRPIGLVGEHDFILELKWSGIPTLGTAGGTWTVGLPITIEYELIDD